MVVVQVVHAFVSENARSAYLGIPQTSLIVAELGVDADPFVLHCYAALSDKELRLISERTRSARLQFGRRSGRRG